MHKKTSPLSEIGSKFRTIDKRRSFDGPVSRQTHLNYGLDVSARSHVKRINDQSKPSDNNLKKQYTVEILARTIYYKQGPLAHYIACISHTSRIHDVFQGFVKPKKTEVYPVHSA